MNAPLLLAFGANDLDAKCKRLASDSLSLCEQVRSLPARGPFDSLLFYQDLILDPGDFCFIWEEGGGWRTFLVFNFLENDMVYTSGMDVYIYIYI